MRNIFSTALETVEKKDLLLMKFRAVIFSRNADAFDVANMDFLDEASNVMICINQVNKDLGMYYKKNWLSCKSKWVKYFRKDLPLLGDHTTNRVERMFWSLKRSINESFKSLPKTFDSVTHMVKFANNRIEEGCTMNKMRSLINY